MDMKKLFILALTLILAGCGQPESREKEISVLTETTEEIAENRDEEKEPSKRDSLAEEAESPAANSDSTVSPTQLEVCFGDDGEPFILHLYDNDTAAAIARHVGTASWRLPIYHYDDYDNWEIMQYYDIPSRYEIPSDAEPVTSEKAGEVYYSDPNRVILFYGDGEIPGEYTKVGYFDDTEEFREAVRNNPALEGWNTKMVLINSIN
jgi:hypothetical protein